MTIANLVASIPSPPESTIDLGFARIHYYALFILFGIAVAVYWSNRRLVKRGGESGLMLDVAIWAVPFGIVGARIFHVATHLTDYVGEGKDLLKILYVWEGGLAIYGGLIFGVLGAYLAARQANLKLLSVADALAPAVLLAQAIGRWGNYFNQELFGRPTYLPWGLEIGPLKRPVGYESFETFHPTFLYELIWCVLVAYLLIKLPGMLKKFASRNGDVFALYVLGYTIGRLWIEALRIDEANLILGLRLNIWVSLIVIISSFAYLVRSKGRGNAKEKTVAS